MKETGMVRRLDDLGRLVIPKEIRKTYKMKEGDSIEIFIKEGIVSIRKFDEISAFYDQINNMCELLKVNYKNEVFFTSEEYLKKNKIDLEEKMLLKTQSHRATFFENGKIYESEERFSGYICPVIDNGNHYGSFVMLFNKMIYKEEAMKEIHLFANLLASQQH